MKLLDDLQYLKETKALIKQAIINKGVQIESNTPFRQYVDKISEISGGGFTGEINEIANKIPTIIEIKDV